MVKRRYLYGPIVFTIIVLLMSVSESPAQPGFSKGYNFNSTTLFHDVLLKKDTLIIIGTSYDKEEQRWGALFVKMDTLGRVVEHQLILDPNGDQFVFETGNVIIQTSDGGYLITGVIHDRRSYFIMKLTIHGKLDFIKEYSYTYPEIRSTDPYKLVETQGGYFIIGHYQTEDYNSDIFVRKVDKQGMHLWEKLYSKDRNSCFTQSVWQEHENSIYIGAANGTNQIDSGGGKCVQAWIFNIDTTGKILNEYLGKPCDGLDVVGMQPTEDGEWVYATRKVKYFRFNEGLKPLIKKTGGWESDVGENYAYGNSVSDLVKTTTGNYIMSGDWVLPEPFTPDSIGQHYYRAACMFAVDSEGRRLWERCDTMKGIDSEWHRFRSLVALPGGSVVAVGRYRINSTSYGWVVKVGKNGCVEEPCLTSTRHPRILPGDAVYPNPTRGRISFRDGQSHNYRLYTLQGVLLRSGKGPQIDLSDLPDNMYILVYRIGDQTYAERVVKK